VNSNDEKGASGASDEAMGWVCRMDEDDGNVGGRASDARKQRVGVGEAETVE
jgi:hypothetical protein